MEKLKRFVYKISKVFKYQRKYTRDKEKLDYSLVGKECRLNHPSNYKGQLHSVTALYS